MGLFGKLFKKNKSKSARILSDYKVKIKSIHPQGAGAVEVVFELLDTSIDMLPFTPGQYITIEVVIDGKLVKRSYSICSRVGEDLAIGVRAVKDGLVSNWFNATAKIGDELTVSAPMGNFKMVDAGKSYVAFAAGSGITPILSMAKSISLSDGGKLDLFYGNKTKDMIMFKDELDQLNKDHVHVGYWLSQEEQEGFQHGRLSKDTISSIIKSDLSLLKKEGFFICGPEQMIVDTLEALKTFGVSENKIHYELFASPVLMKSKQTIVTPSFHGVSKVVVILDDEEIDFDLETDGATILSEAESHAVDAPFSCRGGVCCTCKAKVLKGEVRMDSNLVLTDKEIEEGYVLTCQAHPASEEVIISYDE